MKEQLEKLRLAALKEIADSEDLASLENARVKFLGKKGEITSILKQMGSLSPEERPVMGQMANAVRKAVEDAITDEGEKLKKLQKDLKLKAETSAGRGQGDIHRHGL